ncbi:MAG: DEAD/DEAH box helicase, partial [Alphaproteobacteria bacterium]|nr:DEAD/DEAH box helicase [Alphaproteobacteria bacterium]
VGSGKTLVALCAILNVIESGSQAALMAPTDILANQHFTWISKSLSSFGIKVELLTGKITGKRRQIILDKLNNGEIGILIGTHAIFQDNVEFQDLGLVIIDEQHRFGVQQRMSLMSKGKNADVLVMSATPIPRTLSLTMYGDMDISILSGKPKGRMPVTTYSLQEAKVDKIIELIKKKIGLGEKIYWICPLIEGDVDNDNVAAENRFVFLKKSFARKVGLMHGKLPVEEKDKTMNDFAFGDVDILVSTTVVEVGVDVPDATLLIIESPDRFGLAQLHQLRGRVGRGTKQSECIMLYSPDNLTHSSVSKIKIMKESNDGFYIAEQDLKLRGGGSILGSKQSGLPGFRIADLEFHSDLLSEANKYANEILTHIENEETQQKVELLLNVFGYKENFKLISAG